MQRFRSGLFSIGSAGRERSKPQSSPSGTAIVGFIDALSADQIVGWAATPNGQPQLTVSVCGITLETRLEWHDRPDVAQVHGPHALQSGFKLHLDASMVAALFERAGRDPSIDVFADGHALEISAGATVQLPRVLVEPIGRSFESGTMRGELVAWRPFKLLLDLHAPDTGRPVDITATAGDANCPCIVVRSPLDAGTGQGQGKGKGGGAAAGSERVEIEVPGYAWTFAENDACNVDVFVDGEPLDLDLAPLMRAKAAEWINASFADGSVPAPDYFGLLCLEHIRHGGLGALLTPEVRAGVVDYAQSRNLREYIEEQLAVTAGDLEKRQPEDLSATLLNKALRRFNDELDQVGSSTTGGAFDLYRRTSKLFGLRGTVAEDFLFSVTPLLCARDEFKSVPALAEAAGFERLVKSHEPWPCTLAIAYLATTQRFGEAAALLYRLAERKGGWPNTECVLYALRHAAAARLAGEAPPRQIDDLSYAFLKFLESFGGEWFSRLHDSNLIQAMALLLRYRWVMPDYLGRDLTAAAIRHYGLVPTFWEACDDAAQRGHGGAPAGRGSIGDTPLRQARAHFGVIRAALEAWPTDSAEIRALLGAFRFFLAAGNPETVMFLRELLAKALASEDAPDALLVKLRDILIEIDPTEVVRFAAFPSRRAEELVQADAELQGSIFDALRTLSDRPKSHLYHVQEHAAAAMSNLRTAVEANNAAALEAAVEEVAGLATALNGWNGQFIGCDLLVSAYQAAHAQTPLAGATLARALGHFETVIAETDAGYVLPAAVVAALARLETVGSSDPLIAGLRQRLVAATQARFADKHAGALSLPASPVIKMATDGWPTDTLVVVYSCRKYLDSRIPAIRDTWIKDLKARGIPYVILVGDGDDTLQGDVLALNVSDRYEDLPQKSLALFDWVYRNTDAQYVLKIDDDCYLDVARYFDTLSYRKFHYYGRVIRRQVGGTDRTWHHSKSQSVRGRLALDKSPEPCIFADGGGGYCLSRLAITKLLEQANTLYGQQFKISCFLEDHLVGGLLASAGIGPDDEDYDSYQRRRTHQGALPIGFYENIFYPGPLSPAKIVHLDNAEEMARTARAQREIAALPKKLAPTARKFKVGWNSNQLELISGDLGCFAQNCREMAAIVPVRNELVILPHFLSHYRSIGIKTFFFVDNASDDGTREYLAEQPDIVLFCSDTEFKASIESLAWHQGILGNLCVNRWCLIVDADEFLLYPDWQAVSLPEYLELLDRQRVTAARALMIDAYPKGPLADADLSQAAPFECAKCADCEPVLTWRLSRGAFSNSECYVSGLRHRLMPDSARHSFTAHKTPLFKYQPWVRLSSGVHDSSGLHYDTKLLPLVHFKYHSGFAAKALREAKRGQHFNGAYEYKCYAKLVQSGVDTLYDERASEPLEAVLSKCFGVDGHVR